MSRLLAASAAAQTAGRTACRMPLASVRCFSAPVGDRVLCLVSFVQNFDAQVFYHAQQLIDLLLLFFFYLVLGLHSFQLPNDRFEMFNQVFKARGHCLIETAVNASFCLSPTDLQQPVRRKSAVYVNLCY